VVKRGFQAKRVAFAFAAYSSFDKLVYIVFHDPIPTFNLNIIVEAFINVNKIAHNRD
jgi:hypothetical protein